MVIFSKMVICTNISIKLTVNVQLTSNLKYNFKALSTTPDLFLYNLHSISSSHNLFSSENSFLNILFEVAEHYLQVTQNVWSKFLL